MYFYECSIAISIYSYEEKINFVMWKEKKLDIIDFTT